MKSKTETKARTEKIKNKTKRELEGQRDRVIECRTVG